MRPRSELFSVLTLFLFAFSSPFPSTQSREMKEIDLLHLTSNADVDVIVNQIVAEEPLISESKKPHLRKLLYSTCIAHALCRSVDCHGSPIPQCARQARSAN